MARVIAFEDAKARLMGRRIVRKLCLTDDERRAAWPSLRAIIDSNASAPLAAWLRQTPSPCRARSLLGISHARRKRPEREPGRKGDGHVSPSDYSKTERYLRAVFADTQGLLVVWRKRDKKERMVALPRRTASTRRS